MLTAGWACASDENSVTVAVAAMMIDRMITFSQGFSLGPGDASLTAIGAAGREARARRVQRARTNSTQRLLLFPDKDDVDRLPVWGDTTDRGGPGLAVRRHFAD